MILLAKSSGLVLAGVILCFVASIIAVLLGIVELLGMSLNALINAVILIALGLVCLIFTLRIYRKYYQTYTILLLVFSIIFIVLGVTLIGTYGWIVGILLLLGAILLLVAKA